jgi:6-phosphogluconolactonase
MPSVLYVSLQDENRIAAFAITGDGGLSPQTATPVDGGPSALAVAPDRRVLYVGHRDPPAISAFRIDRGSGALALLATVATPHAPTYLAPDRSGRHLLSAYYQGGFAAVHRLRADGAPAAPESDRQTTATGAHAIQTDPSNRFAFVPHIARLNDNVLEPARDNPGPNVILQFRFDAAGGRLVPNAPFRVEPAASLGPRHYCFHPMLPLAYFSNEQGSSVSAYRLDPATGTLAAVETVSTLPDGFAGRNTCSQIHLIPSARFLYVGNRGHNSIAGFAVDAAGHLSALGRVPTEPVPSAFGLDPDGDFLYAAGSASGRLAGYRIDRQSGALTALAIDTVGRRPMAVLALRLGE